MAVISKAYTFVFKRSAKKVSVTKLIGIDVGGTFTDFVLLDEAGTLRVEKVSSSGLSASQAVIEGLHRLGVKTVDLFRISYGTTVATNALLERSGAETGLIATEGFRDVLEMQRWHRKDLYDLHQRRPKPFVRRSRRVTVPERVAADGTVLRQVSEAAVVDAVQVLLAKGTESIAVCLLNSYVNPENERKVRDIVRRHFPSLPVSISTDVAPIIREYERTIVTVINAYVQPFVQAHLQALYRELKDHGFQFIFEIVQSNGGLISLEDVVAQPVRMILSGPAGGVTGASFVGHQAGELNLITLDMGGTSCDVSLVRDSRPDVSKEEEIEWNIPISVPMVSVKTIGNGGGSIVWIDQVNVMKVGPNSAGSDPGPACYGHGGTQPTITDAHLLLGRLNESGLLSGRLPLRRDLAHRAFQPLADLLGMTVIQCAAGAITIANHRMIEAIRLVTVDRGYDPRDCVLLAFGGAGPMHACEMAGDLGIKRILIPRSPGVLSALGLAVADVKTNQIASVNRSLSALTATFIVDRLEHLKREASRVLKAHGIPRQDRSFTYSADIRYEQQSYEVQVISDSLERGDLDGLASAFHDTYRTLYHYAMPEQIPFVVNLEITGVGFRPKPSMQKENIVPLEPIPARTRSVFFHEAKDFIQTPVYDRDDLSPGSAFLGPAIVDQFDTTTIIPPHYEAYVDAYRNLILAQKDLS